MQFKKGVTVTGVKGQKVGEVSRVVIEPRSGEVTHIVVQKGFLFGTDKVVPVSMVSRTSDDQVLLTVSQDDLKELPDFLEIHYVPLNEQEMARHGVEAGAAEPVYWYPVSGTTPLMWGAGTPGMVPSTATPFPYKLNEKENIPKGEVALKEGAKVLGSDGKQVGHVEKVLAEDEKDRVTGLLITKGLLNKEQKMIPASWISAIKEDGVQLAVTSDFVNSLKEFKE